MKTVYCIIGRTSSGKDTLAQRLSQDLEIPMVVSYTTRKKRETETNGTEHYFVTENEFNSIVNNNTIIAYTQIGDIKYCAILEDLNDKSLYIIDPRGVECLKENSDLEIKTIYLYADTNTRRERAKYRSDFTLAWENRNLDENDQFSKYEQSGQYDLFLDNNGYFDFEHLVRRAKEFIGQ